MRYIFNKELGVTVALMDGVHNRLQRAILKVCPIVLMRASGIAKVIKRFPDTYKGIARCDPADKWNEEVGRSIAGARAELSYTLAEAKVLEALRSKLADAYSATTRRLYHIEDVAESLLDDAYPY